MRTFQIISILAFPLHYSVSSRPALLELCGAALLSIRYVCRPCRDCLQHPNSVVSQRPMKRILTNLFNHDYNLYDIEGYFHWIGVQGTRKLLEEHLGEVPHVLHIVLRGR
jgi:hypothetical protein